MEVSQDKRFATAREMQKAMRKSYAQMQEQMGAKTMIMGADGPTESDSTPVAVPSMDKTEVMDYAVNPALSVPTAVASSASEAPTNLVSQPNLKAFDPNATIAFDQEPLISEPRQADVKTEVFLAGSNSLPTPSASQPPPAVDAAYTEDFSPAEPSFDPNATRPISAFAGTGEVASVPENDTNYYTSDLAGNEAVPSGFESAAEVGANGEGPSSQAAPAFVPAKAAAAKKSSGGKVFAAVAGLLIVLVLGAGALGGGYYYYANYYAVAQEPEASPSPVASVEPSVEPTVDIASQSNSDSGNTASTTDSNTSSNASNSDVLTVAPTPEVRPETEATPQQTGTTTTKTPTQTRNTPTTRPPGNTTATKPSPKPTSTRDRKIILQ
jgi:hypothetical protein